ncbi:hypothetical protein GF348_20040 [candidate division KSB3 bacterium]|nr:hypothetical protein [candidate division KSB3 bacterium]
MKQRITRLSVLQTGKLLAMLYGFISVIMLPFMLLGMSRHSGGGITLFMLLLYPVMGFVGGIIMAALYNLASGWIGGLEITVEETGK